MAFYNAFKIPIIYPPLIPVYMGFKINILSYSQTVVEGQLF